MPPAAEAEAAKTAAPPLRHKFGLLLPRHACMVQIGCGYVRLAMFEFKFPAVLLRGLCVHVWGREAERQAGEPGGYSWWCHR